MGRSSPVRGGACVEGIQIVWKSQRRTACVPPVRGCVGLWRRGQQRGTPRKLRAVWGLCGRRLTWEFCEGISRGKTTRGAVPVQQFLRVKSGGFGRPKKVLDKGRWSLATTSRPQSPAVRGFPGFWYRRRFSRFRSFSAVVGLRGATVSSSSGVFHRRCELRGFFG